MNGRLQQFLAAENISQAQFADSISVARASVSHIVAGRNKPGFDFISSMLKRYPTLNVEWLITGHGKMYKNAPDSAVAPISTPTEVAASATPEPVAKASEPFAEEAEITFSAPSDMPAASKNAVASEEISGTQMHAIDANIKTTIETIASSKASEVIKSKRKAVKVMIFFDDGSYQEF